MNKKGQVMMELGNLGKGIAVLSLVMVVALILVGNVRTQVTEQDTDGASWVHGVNGSAGFNATHTLADATMDIPGWVPLIVVVSIGGLILLLIRRAF